MYVVGMFTPLEASFRRFAFVALTLAVSALAYAKPSGGPYGPVRLNYDLPDVEGTIYYVAPDGSSDSAGTSLNDPTTLKEAFGKAVDGDAVVLRGGTYRSGDLVFNQGLVVQPYADEMPIVKGTKVASDWEALQDGSVCPASILYS